MKPFSTISALSVMLLLFRDQHAQILSGPTSQEVLNGDTATFNCSFVCGNPAPVTWYLTLPTTLKTVTVTPYTQFSQIKSFYGIEVSRGCLDDCARGGTHVEQLYVRATRQLHLMPVQCYTLCFASSGAPGGEGCACGAAQSYFSRVGLLSVTDVVSSSPSTATPSSTANTVTRSSKFQDGSSRTTSKQSTMVTMASTPTPFRTNGVPGVPDI